MSDMALRFDKVFGPKMALLMRMLRAYELAPAQSQVAEIKDKCYGAEAAAVPNALVMFSGRL